MGLGVFRSFEKSVGRPERSRKFIKTMHKEKPTEDKRKVLKKIENKTTREAKKTFYRTHETHKDQKKQNIRIKFI